MNQEKIQVTHFDSKEELIEATAILLSEQIQAPSDSPLAIMLSGGGTPLPAYEKISADPPVASDSLHFLFSDERCVAVDSPENNCANIAPMFFALGLDADQVLRVESDLPAEQAAEKYQQDLREFFDRDGQIPLGLLGIGNDGHTASLFSLADVESSDGNLAIPIYREEGPDRVSVTPELLGRIERLIFLITDRSKDEIVVQLLKDPASLPAGAAVMGAAQVELWIVV